MMILDYNTENRNKKLDKQVPQNGDKLNITKFNNLPSPVTAVLIGGGEYWIESLCVQTGLMRLDISGMIDREDFIMVKTLIDANGNKHNPDEFWIG